MDFLSYKDLSNKEKRLIDAAEKATDNAYSPYKGILVGGAVLTESGKIIKGSNFGNATTSFNICAERATILTANSLGHRKIIMLAIIGKEKNKPFKKPLTPCGTCRQFLTEITRITGKELIILSSNTDKTKIIRTNISELLPYHYTRNSLGK